MFCLALLACAWAEWSLYTAIRRQAGNDEARPADAIVVFGAAEYNGAPSPVLKARLDHALELDDRGLAPVLITTGGSGGDPAFHRRRRGARLPDPAGCGGGQDFLRNAQRHHLRKCYAVAQILKQRHARTCIAVSDGFHLYRIKLMFRALGITAFGSPAPDSPIEGDPTLRTLYSLREMGVTTLWRLGLKV